MKRLALGLFLAVAAGCASEGPPRMYDNNDLELVVGNAARSTCSCIFVMEMSDEYCLAWTKASPDVARWSVDRSAKTVEASAFISWAAKARYVNSKIGCILE